MMEPGGQQQPVATGLAPSGYLLKQSDADPGKYHKRWFSLEWQTRRQLELLEGKVEGWVLRCQRRPPPSDATVNLQAWQADIDAHQLAEANRAARRKAAADARPEGSVRTGVFELGALMPVRRPNTPFRARPARADLLLGGFAAGCCSCAGRKGAAGSSPGFGGTRAGAGAGGAGAGAGGRRCRVCCREGGSGGGSPCGPGGRDNSALRGGFRED